MNGQGRATGAALPLPPALRFRRMQPILELKNVSKRFAATAALTGMSLVPNCAASLRGLTLCPGEKPPFIRTSRICS